MLDRDDPLEPLEQRGDLGGVEHHVAIDVDRAPVRLQVEALVFRARLVDASVHPIPRRAATDGEGGRRRGERVSAQRAVGECVGRRAGGGPVELAAAVAPHAARVLGARLRPFLLPLLHAVVEEAGDPAVAALLVDNLSPIFDRPAQRARLAAVLLGRVAPQRRACRPCGLRVAGAGELVAGPAGGLALAEVGFRAVVGDDDLRDGRIVWRVVLDAAVGLDVEPLAAHRLLVSVERRRGDLEASAQWVAEAPREARLGEIGRVEELAAGVAGRRAREAPAPVHAV